MRSRNMAALGGLVVSWLLAGCANPDMAPETASDLHIFILAGQSNMSGRGAVEEYDREVWPRIWALNRQRQWVPATEPLHFDKPERVGVGPGREFAVALAEARPDIRVGLVPVAVGGSPVESWVPGAYYEQTDSHPWDDAIARARIASRAGQVKAILWHQGEADSRPGRSVLYEARLHDLIARFRDELDAPDLPFIAGQLGCFAGEPWDEHREQVNAVHERLPSQVPATGFVSSSGLTGMDHVHFDTPSYRELGRRYAAAYLNLTGSEEDE